MEVIPFLEPGDKASTGLWYLITPDGQSPCPRVGHACLVQATKKMKNEDDGGPNTSNNGDRHDGASFLQENVIIVAGATPSGPFNDVYHLRLRKDSFAWEKRETENLAPRYEHGIMEDAKSNIYVFGGAQQDSNLNSIQVLKDGEKSWSTCEPNGCLPCPRTCLNVAVIDEKMFVFGGGLKGAEPVSDTQMHVFDAATCSWTQIKTSGVGPGPRHGHVLISIESRLYIHGGMAANHIYNDLFILETETSKWSQIKESGEIPPARTAHAACAVSNFIYIFGGMNLTGALSDLYRFDTDFLVWTRIDVQGPPPPPRLDHTLCCVEIQTNNNQGDTEKQYSRQKILISFGGMDTAGEIFNDLLAIAVD